VLSVVLLHAGFATAQEPVLRYSPPGGGDPRRPVQFLADDIATWQEDGIRVFVLNGNVVAAQSPFKARMSQAVVWVDEEGQRKTGVYMIKVAGEKVELDEGGKKQAVPQAVLDFSTRGEIAVKAYVTKMVQKNLSSTELYQTAFRVAQVKTKAPIAAAEKAKTPTVDPGLTGAAKGGAPAAFPLLEPADIPGLAPPRDQGNIRLTQSVVPVPAEPTLPGVIATPLPPPPTGTVIPGPSLPLAPPAQPPRQLIIRPRSSLGIEGRSFPQANGEVAVVVPNGVILTVVSLVDKKVLLDIEADRLVFWTKGGESGDVLGSLKSPSGKTSNSMEFYLSGNVEIRNQSAKESQILRADEVYYDVGRGVAIALRGDLEIQKPGMKYPVHMRAAEIVQLNPKLFVGKSTEVFSSSLPSDPGLKVELVETTVEERETPKKSIFGVPFIDRATGKPRVQKEHIFTGRNMFVRLEGVPVFYFPYLRGRVEDPLGPLETINFNYSQVFGFQLMTTWNLFDLLGRDEPDNTRWSLMLDYLSLRGPAAGTNFDTAGVDLFGVPNKYALSTKAYGIFDRGVDILGGGRGTSIKIDPTTSVPVTHPDFRGRWQTRLNVFDLPYGFQVQGQFAAISDRNFLEQYYPAEWFNEMNQETFLYAKQQQANWAWSILAEPRIRDWITETEWLPRGDAYLIGEKFFNLLTYNTHASAGYARLRPTEEPSPAYAVTDVRTDTGRFDWSNELSMPLVAGPFRVAPYLVGDVTYYTQDLTGNDTARIYGGAGVRSTMSLSRLFPEVCSDIFNVDGIYHKVLFYGNAYAAQSSQPYTRFPQLDRLNDDTSDQALRDIRPWQTSLNPQYGTFLTTSPIFDPQVYAIRRLVDSRIDTRDSIQVVQLGVNQRWQTRRGLPGNQHVIDWMSLDLRASVFPRSDRDNFGNVFGILEYDWVWNIGDRTALTSSGWAEPIDNGPRVFNFGGSIGRPDSTSLYLGYRQIDPLNSRAFVGSITYPFSAKYALTGSTVYDFGVHQASHSFNVTRIGTDLLVSLGFNYNSTLSTFGLQFEILPVLAPARYRTGGIGTNTGLAGLGR